MTAQASFGVTPTFTTAGLVDAISATVKILRETTKSKLIASGLLTDSSNVVRGIPSSVASVTGLAGSVQLIPSAGTITAMRAQLYGRRKG